MGRRRKSKGSNLGQWLSPQAWAGRVSQAVEMDHDTKRGVTIIVLWMVVALCILGLFDLSGSFGQFISRMLALAFGDIKWCFPIIVGIIAYFLLRPDHYRVRILTYFGAVLLMVSLTTLWHVRFDQLEALMMARDGLGGGYLGVLVSDQLLVFLGLWGTVAVCIGGLLIGLLLIFETSLNGLMWPLHIFNFVIRIGSFVWHKLLTWINRPKSVDTDDYEQEAEVDDDNSADEVPDDEPIDTADEPKFTQTPINDAAPVAAAEVQTAPATISMPKKFGRKIDLPLDLFTGRSGKPTSGDIKTNQEIIKRTLANFQVNVEMGAVNIGPTVTQYTFRPADGVRLAKITNLNGDLALALAAHPIRIEAPIPGKSLVGVEVPNQVAARVTMYDLLTSKEFKDRTSNMMISLGKDVSGQSYFAQLDRMPHLLIAGATGSGKSVCVNSIIISLMCQNSPDELKFIMVDPKRVELPAYNNLPYLLTPVITDVKKTVNALKWAVVEMERRFEVLSKAGKRNIESYNQTAKDKMPYIVFIIDELADLMGQSANDIEAGVVRLAQMARAVGIHLILATQRPSVEVITGLIKANVPARIAFSVMSLIDSRTILDTSGAEKLVGRGDMLYVGPETSKPKRIQGVFLSDREIHSITEHIRSQGEASYVNELNGTVAGSGGSEGGMGSDDGDALLPEAKEAIKQAGKASASLLQRRLKVGYARAARLLDLLEERGIIGPADGAKPREVFLDRLGGDINPVAFAAREHDLVGELRPDEEDVELNEPEPLVVWRDNAPTEPMIESLNDPLPELEDDQVEVGPEDLTEIEELEEEIEDKNEEVELADEEDIADDTTDEEIEEIDESDNLPDPDEDQSKSGKKKTFADDEWS